MTIAAAARQAGVGVETIRYYERRGLIRRPAPKGKYRHYSEQAIREIRFVREAQRLGFTLNEIRDLLAIAANDAATCGDVCQATERKRNEVRRRIQALQQMERELSAMLCSTECTAPPRECKLIESLNPEPAGGSSCSGAY